MGILRRLLAEAGDHGVRDVDFRVAMLFVLTTASALFTHGARAQKLGLGRSHPVRSGPSGSTEDV